METELPHQAEHGGNSQTNSSDRTYTVEQILYDLFDVDAATLIERRHQGTTVDGLETGHVDMIVTGMVTSFSASQRVIQHAAQLGANVIIAHEGLFYSHQDQRDQLLDDPVYKQKLQLIEQTNMHIIRLHDAIHREERDEVMEGLLRRLEWCNQVVEETSTHTIVELPQAIQLDHLAAEIKQQLSATYIRLSGQVEQQCQRIGVLVGYRGSAALGLPLLSREDVDVLIVGEGPEWELPEYVRDAVEQGRAKALIMIGHAESELPGMQWLAERLASRYNSINVSYVANEPVFRLV